MILLDAYAVISLLRAEPAAPDVARLLEGDSAARLTVLGIAEVVDHVVRLAGATEDNAALDVAQLGLAEPEDLSEPVCLRAGLLRARHYDRRDRAVSLADCVLAETARAMRAAVATADPHLLDMCIAEGIAVVPLPDARGAMWRETGSAEPPE